MALSATHRFAAYGAWIVSLVFSASARAEPDPELQSESHESRDEPVPAPEFDSESQSDFHGDGFWTRPAQDASSSAHEAEPRSITDESATAPDRAPSRNGPGPVSLQGGIGFELAFPRGEMYEQLRRLGLGFSLSAALGHRSVPWIYLGLEIDMKWWGRRSERVPWPAFPNVQANVRTETIGTIPALFVQIRPDKGNLRPFVSGLAGVHVLYTQTSLRVAETEVSSRKLLTDYAWVYGLAGGVDIRVQGEGDAQAGRESLVRLGLKVHFGDMIGFTHARSVEIDETGIHYVRQRAPTHMIQLHLGVAQLQWL